VVRGRLAQRKDHRAKLIDPPSPGGIRSRKRAQTRRAPGLLGAGRLLIVLAAPVLPAVAAFGLGWIAAALTVRTYPSEARARWALDEGRTA
jgi:hypothetical protein